MAYISTTLKIGKQAKDSEEYIASFWNVLSIQIAGVGGEATPLNMMFFLKRGQNTLKQALVASLPKQE